MPCWYYEKKEIKNSPSFLEGLDTATECRYRRDGARFIIDAGTKLGLRFDTCATGVVYFHRFYMFHSFKEFPRHVTAACCLFLAGKVEETPKKCRDIIKISQQLLTQKQFAVFGEDPREEVMTLERILLQTVKFDLQVEHPYALLLKFAKSIKGDKEKVQKLVQMAWTFINDSLCTTLSLQWEPEVIAISLMYLGTRLNKFDIQDWVGKMPGTKHKWWEHFVEDLSVELMEDICHQVLDLYSPSNQAQADESPPPPPPSEKVIASATPASDRKRSLPTTPSEPVTPSSVSSKSQKVESGSGGQDKSQRSTPVKVDKGRQSIPTVSTSQSNVSQLREPPASSSLKQVSSTTDPYTVSGSSVPNPYTVSSTSSIPTSYSQASSDSFSQYNPYVSSNMYSSSFMSQEGSQSLQTVMGNPGNPATTQYGGYPSMPVQPPGMPYSMPGAPAQQYPGNFPGGYPQVAPVQGQQAFPAAPMPQQFQGTGYPVPQGQHQNYQNYPQQQQVYGGQGQQSQGFQPGGAYPGGAGNVKGPRPNQQHKQPPKPPPQPGALTVVRITGR